MCHKSQNLPDRPKTVVSATNNELELAPLPTTMNIKRRMHSDYLNAHDPRNIRRLYVKRTTIGDIIQAYS